MATVWAALAAEAIVLLTAAGMAVKWVRQQPSQGSLDPEGEQQPA